MDPWAIIMNCAVWHGWKWIRMTFSCPRTQTLCLYTPSYIHSSVLSLWNFPQDIGCQDPPLWPSLHYRLFIVAWLISGNTRSHLHLFYWWALLWWPRLACPLHNRTRARCICEHVEIGGHWFPLLREENHTFMRWSVTRTLCAICATKCN